MELVLCCQLSLYSGVQVSNVTFWVVKIYTGYWYFYFKPQKKFILYLLYCISLLLFQ